MTDMLSEALEYARRGWYVFPCREKPGDPFIRNGETIILSEKTPYTAKGLNDASRDEYQIKAWWGRWKDALIGVNAGKSGLFVIDIDRKHVNGLDTYTKWHINDSAGLHSKTPSGGFHIIFTGIGKSNTNANTGIDTRGDGGYFIAPPSKIINGTYVGEYTKMDDWSRIPGVIPDGLMSKLFPEKTIEYVRGNFNPVDGKKELSRFTLNFLLNGAPEGERNKSLFKAVADIAGCGYTRKEAEEKVSRICKTIGLESSEIEQVLTHAYSKPRTSSIPDTIQEKIVEGGKKAASKITPEEQIVLEDVLLACMIMDNSVIPTVNDILNFQDFQTIRNREIYKTINRLYLNGLKVDFVTVNNEISKETDKINMDAVSKIINQYFVDTEHAPSYANIIREKASIRKIDALMDNKAKYFKLGSLPEIINTIEKDISDIAVYGGTKSTNVLTSGQAADFVAEKMRQMQTGQIEQLKTGFTEYDYHVGGLFSNEFVICAGRAGDGKSALALSLINNIAIVQKKPVVLFSLEMSTQECMCRLICQLTGLDFKKVYQGKLTVPEWKICDDAMEEIKESPIYFDDSYGMSVPEIRLKIRKMMENDIQLVVIDQLEQINSYLTQPPYIRLDQICYDIKNFTKEFNIPVLLNHQLNRNITDRKLKNPEPQLSDLNQAGEKPANQVWVISHQKDDKGKILTSKIKVLKNRNGPRVVFRLQYIGERMLFSNPTREEDRSTIIYDNNTQVSIDDEYDDNPPMLAGD